MLHTTVWVFICNLASSKQMHAKTTMDILIIIILIVALCTFLFYASYSINSGVYLHAFCRKNTDEKIVALTFDDGPDSTQTPLVLDVLKSRNIPAAFFCIGHKLAGNEDIVRRIDAEGHIVGNHSYAHIEVFPLRTTRIINADLMHCQHILEDILKKEIKWFRPPFGVTNPPIARAVEQLGYTVIGWNIRTMDTQRISHEQILQRIRKRLRPGSVILMHDRMPQSDVLLIKVLDLLEGEGYRIVGLNEMI